MKKNFAKNLIPYHKKTDFLIALFFSLILFVILPNVANAQTETGICSCDYSISGTLVTESNCDDFASQTGSQCNWDNSAKTCGCMGGIAREMKKNECKSSPMDMIEQEYPDYYSLIKTAGISVSGSCSWAARGALPTTEGEAAPAAPAELSFPPPLGETEVQPLIARVISAILGIVGSIALLMFIIGGFIWLTAAGSADRITLAKNILVWSIIGLVVIFSAYAITRLILTAILS
ncbi:pilin [Patescibacteria group bacterium]|nr:pilin [Patescibacteria group bacterium]MBU1921910.1 pilin [Patescibacteria group bacterium]